MLGKYKAFSLALYLVVAIVFFSTEASAVKSYLFRKCEENPFCKRNRHYADQISSLSQPWEAPYEIDISTLTGLKDGTLTANILKITATGDKVELPLTVKFLKSGSVRITVDEKIRADGDIEVYGSDKLQKRRYNTLDEWALDGHIENAQDSTIEVTQTDSEISIEYGNGNKVVFVAKPFEVKFYRNGETQVILNDRGLLNYEHWRPKPTGEDAKDPQIGPYELEEGLWEDKFDSKTDKKSKGPEAIALDVTFVDYKHVYGIPEHADKLSLRETRGGPGNHEQPYRLYNVDIFEYETNSPMAMYGSIPFMQAHKPSGSAGVFWLNSADTYVDIIKTKSNDEKVLNSKQSTQTHWISEAGLLDIFVFLGDSPEEINKLYSDVTGFLQLPQTFSIAYHQCRWNYNSQDDVLEVNDNFDKHDIPYDVIWLDIEYADEKKYFLWNKKVFPDPVDMLNELDTTKRKLVTINDPHIKADENYDIFNKVDKNGLAIQDAKGGSRKGHCWPGESIWIDTLSPKARQYWDSLFASGSEFAGAATNWHIWNDMNEPSVFSGPETTAYKDDIHFGGWEHREVHNVYGLTYHNATAEALKLRYSNAQRPFVLTRAYFAGSQRVGPMWTGDNMAKWEHLKIATPMILTSGVAGMPFAGADVGGFFENPSHELLTRWYQAGAFYPFFRGHAHIDSKRREPWVPGGEYTEAISSALKLRYKLLPTLYTAFQKSSVDGSPILKPVYYISPDNEDSFDVDDEFFVGDSGILVKPITDEGAISTNIYLPDEEIYYDYNNNDITLQGAGEHSYSAPLNTIPIVVRGGHIHVVRERERRSSTLMKYDPYTVVIYLNKDGNAEGSLYADDGETYNYADGEYLETKFKFEGTTLVSTPNNGEKLSKYLESLWIEKVVIVGYKGDVGSTVQVSQDETEKSAIVSKEGNVVVVKPRVTVASEFKIELGLN